MVNVGYVPERGDIVWIDFMPQAGHEQARRMMYGRHDYAAYI